MSGWQPNAQGIQHILQLLNDSKASNTAIQQKVNKQLEHFNNTIPDFNNYLAYIFSSLRNIDASVRQVGGLLLKTNYKSAYDKSAPDSPQNLHIKQLVLEALSDPSQVIRGTAGNIITNIVVQKGLKTWPQAIPFMIKLLETQDANAIDGAMAALFKLSEDLASDLIKPEFGNPAQIMIPKFVQYMGYSVEVVRRDAISSIIQFLPLLKDIPVLFTQMDKFLTQLMVLGANDSSKRIRKYVCRSYVFLLDQPQYLKPYIKKVIEYVVQCTSDSDPALALEACEFWNTLTENDNCKEFLSLVQLCLSTLVPLLVQRMVYSEEEKSYLDIDSQRPDKDTDVAPQFHSGKIRSSTNDDVNYDDYDDDPDAYDDEYDDDEYDDEFDGENEWTLRKCAASALDLFSTVYGNAILPFLLPKVKECLHSTEWEVRESAILSIGAVSEGCGTGMAQYLPQLIPMLLKLTQDPMPLVRSISCWSLSRYTRYLVEPPLQQVLPSVLQHILGRVLDTNKKVQEAACSAISLIEENAREKLVPYLKDILSYLVQGFKLYHKKNVFILYDTLETLAKMVGPALNNPELISILMPPLIERWNALKDDDRDLFPLLECLTAIALAVRIGFQPFAKPVFARCVRIAENALMEENIAKKTGEDADIKEFIVCALDLISGIVDGIGSSVESLVKESKVIGMILHCMNHDEGGIRQAAYGLIGDLAKTCIGHLREFMTDIVKSLLLKVDQKPVAASNNAIWALGEIAIHMGKDFAMYSDAVVQRLLPIMNNKSLNVNILENTAITLGRIGFSCPDVVSAHVKSFCENWCLALQSIKNEVEKEHAFRGMCVIIRKNPQGVISAFAYVCLAMASYQTAKPDLKHEFFVLLSGFKKSMGDQQWLQYTAQFPPQLQQQMKTAFPNL